MKTIPYKLTMVHLWFNHGLTTVAPPRSLLFTPSSLFLWLVVSVRIGGRSGIRCLIRINRSESGFLEFGVQCRNIQLPDFRPARKEFFKSLFEFLVDGSGLCRGCGIGAVRNRQDPAEMLVQAGKVFGLLRAWRQAEEIALRCPFQFGSLFVQSRDRIRERALPCLRGALLQLRANRLNLRERFEAFI